MEAHIAAPLARELVNNVAQPSVFDMTEQIKWTTAHTRIRTSITTATTDQISNMANSAKHNITVMSSFTVHFSNQYDDLLSVPEMTHCLTHPFRSMHSQDA